jgi:ethanolamine utilization protein EutA
VVVNREVLWRSPILITPYLDDNTIDVAQLESFIEGSYKEAGLTREEIDSGAVILTGQALKRRNAKAIAYLFAEESGKFVCASAGHHMESAMAAHGSGAIALSRKDHSNVLNIDMGGGTTKLGLCHGGRLLATAAIEVGGRLIAFDDAGKLERIEGPAIAHAEQAGVDLKTPVPDLVTFSGGVSEFIFGRETGGHNDIGRQLADAMTNVLKEKRIPYKVMDPGQGIRATVIGASQFSVQVSGNTIHVSNADALPVRNIPVLRPKVKLDGDIDANKVTEEVRSAMKRFDYVDGKQISALAFHWKGDPLHARLKALADGICAGLPETIKGSQPLVLMIDGDIGKTIGNILTRECGVKADIVSVDGVNLKEFDYVDIGEVIQPTNVVPLVIKSLLFSTPGGAATG